MNLRKAYNLIEFVLTLMPQAEALICVTRSTQIVKTWPLFSHRLYYMIISQRLLSLKNSIGGGWLQSSIEWWDRIPNPCLHEWRYVRPALGWWTIVQHSHQYNHRDIFKYFCRHLWCRIFVLNYFFFNINTLRLRLLQKYIKIFQRVTLWRIIDG